ncbi:MULTISPECIES: 1,4-dihydroxy-2-naphthoate polyprenyltransferase [Kytococcus]|uniref:1,4-dihydroxy-2-naphthoate polyprenyltransferase n=1 Tax=Kytococcus TaxID=57499 RepID=UPI0008A65FCA|nr:MULTISPECIES: 1,4-dihydroxy-2-naphthoate polyprenyltransferase [Kytococcus]OFS14294.1 1,4-dihydroxy-2-naphthoate polyprenyltransferase [Kytococcus sp. HMSC28H12]
MATLAQWIEGARPRTLPAAVAPVAVGTGAAFALRGTHGHEDAGHWGFALLALVVALALQVGVNYANDYSDGIRGTDEERIGPVRLVGQRLAPPQQVKAAAFSAFALAGLAGIALSVLSGHWWMLLVGAAAVWAAWNYTGGKNPYGYRGLGEVAVFVFFGLVAVLGTQLTQAGTTSWAGLAGAVGVGAVAAALNLTNNLRDIEGDAAVGKVTLAVRLGARRTRRLYAGLIGLAFLMVLASGLQHTPAVVALLALPLAVPPVRAVLQRARGRALIGVLGQTGRMQLVLGLLWGLGLWWAGR